jgi:hypothetical protein
MDPTIWKIELLVRSMHLDLNPNNDILHIWGLINARGMAGNCSSGGAIFDRFLRPF